MMQQTRLNTALEKIKEEKKKRTRCVVEWRNVNLPESSFIEHAMDVL